MAIGPSRAVVAFQLSGGLVLGLTGLGLCLSSGVPGWARVIMGLAAVLFIGGSGWAWSRFRRGPGLWVFDDEGITFPIWRLPPIRWSAVVGFRMAQTFSGRNLVIDIAHPPTYARGLRGSQGRMVRQTLKRFQAVTFLPMVGIDLGPDEIVELARTRRARTVPGAAPLEFVSDSSGIRRNIWPLMLLGACVLQLSQLVPAVGRASSPWRAVVLSACTAGLVLGVALYFLKRHRTAFWVVAATQAVLIVATLLFGHGGVGTRLVVLWWPWVLLTSMVCDDPALLKPRRDHERTHP